MPYLKGKKMVKLFIIIQKKNIQKCNDLIVTNIKLESNIIGNYNDYLNKCYKYLDSVEEYSEKDFTINLQNIYNENQYNF